MNVNVFSNKSKNSVNNTSFLNPTMLTSSY